VDDSIVRGNTSRKIVEMARKAGAKKVYFASASPPIIGPDPYGIDLPTTTELIASNHTIPEIKKMIGADGLFYNTIDDMRKSIRIGNKNIKRFSDGCFTGKYPTPEVTPKMLHDLGCGRNETRESFNRGESDVNPDQTKMMALV
jgi:amidophosphoribosyltransferase